MKFWWDFQNFHRKNVLDYVVWKRVVALFFPQCGKEWWPTGVNWLKGNCLLSIRLSLTNGFLQQQLPYATLFVWLSVEFMAAIIHLSTFNVWHCFEKNPNRNTYTLNNLKMFISIGTVCKTLFYIILWSDYSGHRLVGTMHFCWCTYLSPSQYGGDDAEYLKIIHLMKTFEFHDVITWKHFNIIDPFVTVHRHNPHIKG